MNSTHLLDREFLQTLEKVSLLCRAESAGAVGADHRSHMRGPGIEFTDYRRYSKGDDPRSLDWKAYLRLGKLFLKIYETELHIPVRVLLDCSKSMDCESVAESKFVYGKRLAATIIYLALLHMDPVAVVPFGDRAEKPLVTGGGRDHFLPVLKFLDQLTCRGRTDLVRSAREFVGRFPSRGMAVLISDFFDDQGGKRAVEMLRTAGHDFVLIQVHSAEEQRPSASGELILQEAETGALRTVECSAAGVQLYERRFFQFSDDVRSLAHRYGGRYARAVTDIPYQEFVLQTLRSSRVVS